jgi:predicted PurR-regulated permease PerM
MSTRASTRAGVGRGDASEERTAGGTPNRRRRVALELPWSTIWRAVGVAILVWVWFRLSWLVMVLLVAAVLAVAVDPLVTRLERHGLRRALASILVGVALLAVIVGFAYVTWSTLVDQAHVIESRSSAFIDDLTRRSPPFIADFIRGARPSVGGGGNQLSAYLAHTGQSLLNALTVLALGFVLTIYLLIEGKQTYAWLTAYVPRRRRAKVHATAIEVRRVLKAYVFGNVLTSIFAAVFSFAALSLLKVPAALLLALLAGICDFVPVLGFIVSGLPAVLLATTVSPAAAMAVAVLYVGYHAIENYAIAPRVYGDQLKLSDVGVVVAFAAGLSLAGLVGALLALPIAAAYPAIESLWLERAVGSETVEDHARIEHRTLKPHG